MERDEAVRVRGLVKRYPDKDVDDRTRAVTVAMERGLLPNPRSH